MSHFEWRRRFFLFSFSLLVEAPPLSATEKQHDSYKMEIRKKERKKTLVELRRRQREEDERNNNNSACLKASIAKTEKEFPLNGDHLELEDS